MVKQPTGTVTFLFTDIEGSTALLQALGTDRYAAALDAHRHLLRAAFERHDGYEVDYEGDSFFVAFADAGEAVAAAVEVQSALDNHPWADGEAIRVRMGAHTGEPLVAPPKYVGLDDVHRAQSSRSSRPTAGVKPRPASRGRRSRTGGRTRREATRPPTGTSNASSSTSS